MHHSPGTLWTSPCSSCYAGVILGLFPCGKNLQRKWHKRSVHLRMKLGKNVDKSIDFLWVTTTIPRRAHWATRPFVQFWSVESHDRHPKKLSGDHEAEYTRAYSMLLGTASAIWREKNSSLCPTQTTDLEWFENLQQFPFWSAAPTMVVTMD